MPSNAPTPIVDALESEYHSNMTKRLRIWRVARDLERGQRMLRADKNELQRRCAELEAVLREFAYQIANIGTLKNEVLSEAAADSKESKTVKELAPAILRARALLERKDD